MAYTEQQVTSIHKWSDKLFSFITTRPGEFEFENGEFVTLGLRVHGRLIARAYSIVSTRDADQLEFLSIHVPDGPLTSRLVNIQAGDGLWVNGKATGSLTLGHLQPGRNLYLLATGTGLAPFMSLVRDPELYRRYRKIILVHTVRAQRELAYREELEAMACDQLAYVPTVTREPFDLSERGTDLLRSGELSFALGIPAADPEHDRIMLCGNPHMIREMSEYLNTHGWTLTRHKEPGNFTVEKAFALHSDV
jgi:ferredoxin/flavodoxin---NADP+ reductase